jgi:hypothetical protein
MHDAGMFRALGRALVGSAAFTALLVAGPAHSGSVHINDGGACASWSWDANTSTLTCGTTPPPPPPAAGAPTGCSPSISTTPTTLTSAGGSANLSVAGCTVSSGTITYAWSRNGTPNYTTSQTWSDTLPANTSTSTPATSSYQVNACNGTACTGLLPTSPLTATVPVASTSGGGGGGGPPPGAVSCASQGFAKTIFYNWDWAGNVTHLDTAFMTDTSGGAGLGTNGILVVAFTPTSPADVNNLTSISASGYPSPNMGNNLTLAISTRACDLNPAAFATSTSSGPTLRYGVGSVPTSWISGQPIAVALTPGTTYYINVAGRDSVGPSTPNGAQTCTPGLYYPYCDIRLGLQKPPGH